MRFDTIHIPAFGPFTDFSLDFENTSHDIHLVYGANEAGKSSLLRGIHQMFYGIPAQSKDNFVHDNGKLRVGGTVSNGTSQLSFLTPNKRTAGAMNDRSSSISHFDVDLIVFAGVHDPCRCTFTGFVHSLDLSIQRVTSLLDCCVRRALKSPDSLLLDIGQLGACFFKLRIRLRGNAGDLFQQRLDTTQGEVASPELRNDD